MWFDGRQSMTDVKRTTGVKRSLAGGMLLGAVASRILPPLVATISGSLRTRLGEEPFKLLVQDHRTILSLIEKMQDSGDSVKGRTAAFLMFKRKLAKHALAEEDVVYPLLHERANAVQEAMRLYEEHAQMKIHLYELESSLASVSSWRARVRSLDDLLRTHIRDEEEKEFPRLRQMLDEDRSKVVGGLIRREEALVL